MSERILFVDRDGTILEEPHDFQVDSFEKMRFVEGVLPALKALRFPIRMGWARRHFPLKPSRVRMS